MTDLHLQRLDRVSLVAALITPLLLMHAHGFAEASMAVVAATFLALCAIT